MPTTPVRNIDLMLVGSLAKETLSNDGFANVSLGISGVTTIALAATDYTLTTDNQGEAMHLALILTGTLTANVNVLVPAEGRIFVVDNRTTGAFTVTFKPASGAGIAVAQGTRSLIYCDGLAVFPVGGAGGGGGGADSASSEWTWDTATAGTPATGHIGVDQTTYSAATVLRLAFLSNTGVDTTNVILALQEQDEVTIQDKNDATITLRYTLTGPAVSQGTWAQLPVTWALGAGTLLNNAVTTVVFIRHYVQEPAAPTDASYLVSAAHSLLTGERVVMDTATVAWDHSTAGQSKAQIPDGAITYAKLQAVSATPRLLGRSTTGAGPVEELQVGSGLSLTGGTLAGVAASETTPGSTRYGTVTETTDGLLTTVATHPAGVKAALDVRVPAGTPLSVTRFASGGQTVEATPGLTTTSDGRLGVGIAPDPAYNLTVNGAVKVNNSFAILRRESNNNTVQQQLYSATTTHVNALYGYRAGGTESLPAATASGQVFLRLGGRGHDGTAFAPTVRTWIDMAGTETWTPTAQGSTIAFNTTLTGTTTQGERWRMDGAGNFVSTGGDVTSGLAAGLALKVGTAPTTSPADAVQLWVEDLDAAANMATLCIRAENNTITRIGPGLLTRLSVSTPATATEAAPHVLSADESNRAIVPTNTTAKSQIDLPSAASGLVFSFTVYTSQGLRIRAAAGDIIRIAGIGASGSAGYAESTVLYSSLILLAVNPTHWHALAMTGTWTVGT
jgi:hypothetical protein